MPKCSRCLLPLILVTILGACAPQDAVPDQHAHHHAVAPLATQASVDPTDAAWLGIMIPMDEQFLQLLALAPTHASDPALRRTAAELAVQHRAGLRQLVALRNKLGVSAENLHRGHDMPGMMTEQELAGVTGQYGASFDGTLRAEIGDHLRQSILLSRGVTAAGGSPAVRALATQVLHTRTTQLARTSG